MHKDLERLIRPDEEKYRPLLSVEHLHYFVDDKPVLSEVTLDLRAGRCLGILGGDGSGKSSLAQIFTGQFMPAYGQVRHHGKSIKPPGASVSTTAWVMVATVCALIYTSALVGRDPFSAVESLNKIVTDIGALLVGFSFLFFFFVVKTFIDHYNVYDMEHTVKYLTSTSKRLDAKELAPKDIYKTFGAAVPRDRVNAILKAAGLDQDTACEEASLVDLLRSLAVGADALICEDILRDLTAMQQARVIHMLRRLKEERGTAILYISTDVAQLRLIADSIGHLHQGCLVELGPPEDMLDSPLNSSTQDLLANCKVNQKVLEHYAALAKDKDIAGDWLPA
jgi:peptide/nickel transport system ATP-binding protein